MTYSFNLMS